MLGGQEAAKQALHEIVILPAVRPEVSPLNYKVVWGSKCKASYIKVVGLKKVMCSKLHMKKNDGISKLILCSEGIMFSPP